MVNQSACQPGWAMQCRSRYGVDDWMDERVDNAVDLLGSRECRHSHYYLLLPVSLPLVGEVLLGATM